MANGALLQHWMPREFVVATIQRNVEDFAATLGRHLLLLIRLDDPSGELAAGLAATSTLARLEATPAGDSLGFSTVAHDSKAVMQMLADRKAKQDQLADAKQITLSMMDQPHFVVPIRKREGESASFLERISIGRARNHDIVLRHRSVSKFHAWFEYDGDGQLYVRDAESKNGTLVNGVKVLKHKVEIAAGDNIKVGSVECRVCTPKALWQAANS
jgi:hypothetical protein